jgi:hypothetical protein
MILRNIDSNSDSAILNRNKNRNRNYTVYDFGKNKIINSQLRKRSNKFQKFRRKIALKQKKDFVKVEESLHSFYQLEAPCTSKFNIFFTETYKNVHFYVLIILLLKHFYKINFFIKMIKSPKNIKRSYFLS